MSFCSHVIPDVSGPVASTDVDQFGIREMARGLVDGMCELLFAHKAPLAVRKCFKRQALFHLIVREPGDYLKRSKNFVCGFKAAFLREELPDQSGYRPSGRFRNWIRSRSRSQARVAATSLFAALAKSKSGAPLMNCANVYLQCVKAAATLPLSDTATESDVQSSVASIRPLLDKLAVHLGEQFLTQERKLGNGMWSQFATSTKSCLENPRSHYGQAGYFLDRMWRENQVAVPGNFLTDTSFPSNVYFELVSLGGGIQETYTIKREFRHFYRELEPMTYEYYEARLAWESWEKEVPVGNFLPSGQRRWESSTLEYYEENLKLVEAQEDPVYVGLLEEMDDDGQLTWVADVEYPATMELWEHVTDWHISEAHANCYVSWGGLGSMVPVKVHGVCEPLKVRLITIGPAARNRKVIWFQRTCHDWMRQYPCWRLMGVAPKATDIKDCVNNRTPVGQGHLKHEGSDFSGATDNTAFGSRDLIMKILTCYLPAWYVEILNLDNGMHVVHFPRVNTLQILYPLPFDPRCPEGKCRFSLPEEWEDIEPVFHRRGTLMGNLSSFIILCIQVVGIALWTLRDEGDERPIEDLLKCMLDNGDDFYACWRESVHDRFWAYCNRLQFGKSIGKSYFSEFYANINSQSYFLDLRCMSDCKKIPVLNTGLLVGRKKLGDEFDPSVVITELLDGCRTAAMEHRVLRRFTERFEGLLERKMIGRNAFLSCSLGGMGQRRPLPLPRKGRRCMWGQKITPRQQAVASMILMQRANLHLVPFGPLREEVWIKPLKTPLPWDTVGPDLTWDLIRLEPDPKFEWYYEKFIKAYQRSQPVRLYKCRRLRSGRAVLMRLPKLENDVSDFLEFDIMGETTVIRGQTVKFTETVRHIVQEPYAQAPIGLRRANEWALDVVSKSIEFRLRDQTRFTYNDRPERTYWGVNLWGYEEETNRAPERRDLRGYGRRRCPHSRDAMPPSRPSCPDDLTQVPPYTALPGWALATLSGTHGSWTRNDDHDCHGHPLYWWQHDKVKLVNWEYYHSLPVDPPLRRFLYLQSVGYHPGYAWHVRCDICGEILHCGHGDCEASPPRLHYHPYGRVSRSPQDQPGIDLPKGAG